jgi:ClpP class serine protease
VGSIGVVSLAPALKAFYRRAKIEREVISTSPYMIEELFDPMGKDEITEADITAINANLDKIY